MRLYQTGNVSVKFVFASMFAVIFLYITGVKTNSFYLDGNDDFTKYFQEAEDVEFAAMHPIKSLPGLGSAARDTGIAEGHALINASDCYTCHAEFKILTAPSFSEIAARYKNDKDAMPRLAGKVISGSIGTWGDRQMPGHPELLYEDAQKMIQYIMNLNKKTDSTKLPPKI